jgi:hypothetical protein
MNLHLAIEPLDTLVVHLREGREETTVAVRPSRVGARSLSRALDAAIAEGYGECFWPGLPGGQYWWMFKRDAERLEVVAMWTRGGASLWEHVFRATDAAAWVHERLHEEIERLDLLASE